MAVHTSALATPRTPQTSLEPGDRFELIGVPGSNRFKLPETISAMGISVATVEDEAGRPLPTNFDAEANHVVVSPPSALPALSGPTAWLEFQGESHFRLIVEKSPVEARVEDRVTEQGLRITFDQEDMAIVHGGLRSAALAEFDLALQAARLATHAGFDRLICLPLVRDMELLEHQIRTAKTVLRRLRGRALLCDEVGLGKTIEAGLVLSELHMRGLVRSVLVLVPPSLVEQWQGEMRRKFALELISHDDPAFRQRGSAAWGEFDQIIASTHTAKREPHRAAILSRRWDMVIVDEAHHLRHRTTQLWRFASEIQKQFILLLTATPVQNNLDELFNLVTLLEPGLLSTSRQFQRRFVDRRDKLTPRNVDELHQLLGEIMVRNRRSTVGLHFTRRWARTERVPQSAEERQLYESVAEFVRLHLRRTESSEQDGLSEGAADTDSAKGARAKAKRAASPLNRMALLALQMGLGSSSQAAAGTLGRLADSESLAANDRDELTQLAAQARQQHASSKVDRLLQLLVEYPDKMVIFTQFRATQAMLAERLTLAGHEVAVFHGGLTRLEKEAAIEQFRGPARLLLATESGSEGRNLQFAHAVCNFDLPWNPMKIEQRIGRLSRIGQTKDVHVFNLVAAGTIEAAVLHLLEAKLNLFELVIGEIDMILGNLEDDREFQEVVADLWAESGDASEFARRMEELGNRLVTAKEAYLQQRGLDDRLFADRFTPDR
jgi:SNF2 family DNA or RNA helicase